MVIGAAVDHSPAGLRAWVSMARTAILVLGLGLAGASGAVADDGEKPEFLIGTFRTAAPAVPADGAVPARPTDGPSRLGAAPADLVELRPATSAVWFGSDISDRVFFAEGSAELGARARAVLAAQAAWLARRPEVSVIIEGHADESGTSDALRRLSAARANAVRQRLMEAGVAPERLKAVSLGASERIADCDGPECEAQNRRAVTVFDLPGLGRPAAGSARSVPAPVDAVAPRDRGNSPSGVR